jgi:hypothetical protein
MNPVAPVTKTVRLVVFHTLLTRNSLSKEHNLESTHDEDVMITAEDKYSDILWVMSLD